MARAPGGLRCVARVGGIADELAERQLVRQVSTPSPMRCVIKSDAPRDTSHAHGPASLKVCVNSSPRAVQRRSQRAKPRRPVVEQAAPGSASQLHPAD